MSLFLLTSCEDLLTKEIDLDEVGFEPVLVLNSNVVEDSDVVEISLTKNISLSDVDDKDYRPIEDAKIDFFVDGVSFDVETVENPETIYGYQVSLPSDLDLIGKKVEIKASKELYKDISAVTNVPKQFELSDVTYEEKAISPEEGRLLDRIRFTIDDKVDEENFYEFRVFGITRDTITLPNGEVKITEDITNVYLESEISNPVEDEVQTIFSDVNFNGVKYPLSYAINSSEFPPEKKVELVLVARSLSKSKYLHVTSVKKYRNSENFGFFSEPVTVYTNVENGLGALTAEYTKVYKLK